MKKLAVLPIASYPDATSDQIAENAVAAARWAGATLHALALNVDIPPVSSALSRILLDVPQMVREAETLSQVRSEKLLVKVREAAARAAVPMSATVETASIEALGDHAAMRARYFDLAMAGWEAGNPTTRRLAEAVVFGTGRPTMILPDLTAFAEPTTIAIAWDGSRVAARAVADAMPYLESAGRILVLTVVDEKPLAEKLAGERLVDSLGRRGIGAEAISVVAEDCPIGVTLQEHALEHQAGLLVMGAYGHSRLRDFVLGGATEGILSDLRLPVMMSH